MALPYDLCMPVLTIAEIESLLGEIFPRASVFSRIVRITDTELVASAPFRPETIRPGGSISGPTMMALADTAAYYLILAHAGNVPLAVTSSLNIHFLAKPQPGDLEATARFLKFGRKLVVCQVDIRSTGNLDVIAHATVTYAMPSSSSTDTK
jgi:uncharacterized protein (TIGR00369 family)